MIIIYATKDCPKCQILKTKMDRKGIGYTNGNLQEIIDEGYMSVPMIKLGNGTILNFEKANQWINERE